MGFENYALCIDTMSSNDVTQVIGVLPIEFNNEVEYAVLYCGYRSQ